MMVPVSYTHLEYKTCQHGVQEDLYETVCSFSNRYGGYIIMGVEDDGTPIGIKPVSYTHLKVFESIIIARGKNRTGINSDFPIWMQ